MRTWAGLFRHIERMDPLDRRLLAERAEFGRWSAAAEQRVMADLARASKNRSKEIEVRTGVVVEVAQQVAGLPLASFGGAHFSRALFNGSKFSRDVSFLDAQFSKDVFFDKEDSMVSP